MQNSYSGLTSDEVKARVKEGAINNFVLPNVKSAKEIIITNSLSVFNVVNLSVFGVLYYFYFSSGDIRLFWDSLGLVIVTFLNTSLAILQEVKASKALAKIDLLKRDSVYVIRNGAKIEINKNEVVKDDLIFINSGSQIIVDGTVMISHDLEIDESLITGESMSLYKGVGDKLISGSFCLSGSGIYKAEVVGEHSFISKLIKSAKKYELRRSPLQRKINFLFVLSFFVTIILISLDILINFAGQEFTINDVRTASTLAIALIPEGLIFFSTITFMMGVLKIAKEGAIIQKMNAIDSLANINIACIDKTGTLTKNKLALAKVIPISNYPLQEIEILLGSYANLTEDANATIETLKNLPCDEEIKLIESLPFSSEFKFSALSVNGMLNCNMILGAFDILSHKSIYQIDESFEIEHQIKGYRNLLFGFVSSNIDKLTALHSNDFQFEPVAAIAMKDEIRYESKQLLEFFDQRGIETKIFTGDSTHSVLSVLNEIGLQVDSKDVLSCDEINLCSDDQLKDLLKQVKIFTRLKPEQKQRLVKLLRADNKHVVFLGDGVNDVPALKESDLAVSIENGSSVSKEISDIVLLKNDLSVIPKMFDEGIRIINSVSFVTRLFLSKNFVVIILSILAWFSFLNFPLTPRNSSLLSMLGVSLPVYIISLKNSNVFPLKNFLRDVLLFLSFSCFLIIGVVLFANFYAVNFTGFTKEQIDTFLVSILVLLFIVNFVAAVLFDDKKNSTFYIIFGAVLALLYFIFAGIEMDFCLTNIITTFYEIAPLNGEMLLANLLIVIPSSVLLIFVHYIRNKFFNSYSKY